MMMIIIIIIIIIIITIIIIIIIVIIIIVIIGGWSVDVEETMKDLVGQRSRSVLRRIQKVILSHSLNIARTFKVLM